jgi:hypothetical protein
MKGTYRDDEARLTVRYPEAQRELRGVLAEIEVAQRRYDAAKAALDGKIAVSPAPVALVSKLPARWSTGMFVLGLAGGALLGLLFGLGLLCG